MLFFFILSGFLITHLMIQEYKRHNSFDFKRFYMRRVLRIWPLYYITMGLTFFVIPFLGNHVAMFQEYQTSWYDILKNTDFSSVNVWFTSWAFLSNYTLYKYGALVGGSQTWSVSIEEQFYLFGPFLLLIVFRKRPILYLAFTIVFLVIVNAILKNDTPYFMRAFEFLFIGGIGALFYHTRIFDKISKFVDKSFFYFINLFIIMIFSFVPIFETYTQSVVVSMFFLSFILLTVNNRYSFQSNLLSRIGKISYGVYMYHSFVIFIVFSFVKYLKQNTFINKMPGGENLFFNMSYR